MEMENPCGSALAANQNVHDIGSLPLELVLHIAQYLDGADIARSQMVSRRWHAVFTSDAVIKGVLPRTLAVLGMETTSDPATKAMTYFRWLHGLQSARPVKKVFLPWPDKYNKGQPVDELYFHDKNYNPLRRPRKVVSHLYDIAYHSRRLAYAVASGYEPIIGLWDLETGTISYWDNLIDASLLESVRLFDHYLAIISSVGGSESIMTVWDTRKPQGYARHWERVLPLDPVQITIDKDTVVMAPLRNRRSSSVYVWDLRSDESRVIRPVSDLCLWHTEQDENVLVTFEIDWDADPPKVQQTKWQLNNGEQLDRKKFNLSQGGRRVKKSELRRTPNDWYRSYDHKTVTELHFSNDPFATLHLVYDHTLDRLSVRWVESSMPINQFAFPGNCGSLTPHIIYRWVHHLRGIGVYDATTGSATVHPYQLDSREVRARNLLDARRRLPPTPRPIENTDHFRSSLQPFGDREVFGVASENGIQLWFFNPDFAPELKDVVPFLAMEESG